MPESRILLGNFTLVEEQRLLRGNRAEVRISPLSSRFLKRLAAEPGRTVSRSDLIDELWAGNYLVGDQALNRLASETRRAAKAAGSGNLIETVQKSGYRIFGARGERERMVRERQRQWLLRWAVWLFAFAVIVAGLAWLMDTLIGLIWVSQYAD